MTDFDRQLLDFFLSSRTLDIVFCRQSNSLRAAMVFPFRKIWDQKSLDDPGGKIDRALNGRTQRLMIGLSVDHEFGFMRGALVVMEGHGKFMRLEFASCVSQPISEKLRDRCRECWQLCQSDSGALLHWKQCSADLADLQTVVVEKLKQKAGKYVDRVLAVAVVDPGLWTSEFDDEVAYTSFCDAGRLAEQTGVSVIDAFPAQDVSVGGRGEPLAGLPTWLLMSDRARRVATNVNAALVIDSQLDGYVLPPSDGLDAEIPPIETVRTIGISCIESIVNRLAPGKLVSQHLESLLVAGVHDKELLQRWTGCVSKESNGGEAVQDFTDPAIVSRLLEEVTSLVDARGIPFENVICTALHWMATDCELQIKSGLDSLRVQYEIQQEQLYKKLKTLNAKRRSNAAKQAQPDFTRIERLFVSTRPGFERALLTKFQNAFPQSTIELPSQFIPCEPEQDEVSFHAVMAAVLGLMHVDQMPGNLPGVTGGSQQRILGRLTPGRPHQWRQLLREMADFQPPAMKLRNAV